MIVLTDKAMLRMGIGVISDTHVCAVVNAMPNAKPVKILPPRKWRESCAV